MKEGFGEGRRALECRGGPRDHWAVGMAAPPPPPELPSREAFLAQTAALGSKTCTHCPLGNVSQNS